MDNVATHRRRYFAAGDRERAWGLWVTGVGMRDLPPHADYYADDNPRHGWRRGRVLSEYALVLLVSGRGIYRSDHIGEERVAAGEVLLVFPGVWHNYRPDPETGWREYWVVFDGPQADRLVSEGLLSPSSPVLRPGRDPALEALCAQLFSEAVERDDCAPLALSGMLGQILARTLSGHETRAAAERALRDVVERVRRHIEGHFSKEVDIKALARSMGVSYRHLRRVFGEATGLSPHQYQLHLRINRAKELLDDRLPVADVARRTGFGDTFYFSRIFKQKTGLAPSTWGM